MPRLKTLIMFLLVTTLSFALIGCSLIASRSTGPEEVAGSSGELPGWLLLAHRSAESPGNNDDEILNPKELDEDEDEENEDNDSVAASYEQSKPASNGTAGSSEPAPAAPSAPSTVSGMPLPEGGTYTGSVNSDNRPDGHGTWNGPGGITYTGAWKDGKPHGQGTMTHPTEGEITGKWVEGNPPAEGNWFDPSGNDKEGIDHNTWFD